MMKIKGKFLSLFFILVLNVSFASCPEDVMQMIDQIAKDGFIASRDNVYYFTRIENPRYGGFGQCLATGYGTKSDNHSVTHSVICDLHWGMGNWNMNLHCEKEHVFKQ